VFVSSDETYRFLNEVGGVSKNLRLEEHVSKF
jgi:hypothetical protein